MPFALALRGSAPIVSILLSSYDRQTDFLIFLVWDRPLSIQAVLEAVPPVSGRSATILEPSCAVPSEHGALREESFALSGEDPREPASTLPYGRLEIFAMGHVEDSSVGKNITPIAIFPAEAIYWKETLVVGSAQTRLQNPPSRGRTYVSM